MYMYMYVHVPFTTREQCMLKMSYTSFHVSKIEFNTCCICKRGKYHTTRKYPNEVHSYVDVTVYIYVHVRIEHYRMYTCTKIANLVCAIENLVQERKFENATSSSELRVQSSSFIHLTSLQRVGELQ